MAEEGPSNSDLETKVDFKNILIKK